MGNRRIHEGREGVKWEGTRWVMGEYMKERRDVNGRVCNGKNGAR